MLNCIVICRCMDKKPYGNILTSPTVRKLMDIATRNSFRGGLSMKQNPILENSISTITGGAATRPHSVLCNRSQVAAISNEFSVVGTSAVMTASAELGKSYAPLSGN